ncbi:MAG: hypothetical protein U9Q03_03875 [Patescibacteria group bacterium]|nr:hypothetical protein [Patescibacteria group bacterium]
MQLVSMRVKRRIRVVNDSGDGRPQKRRFVEYRLSREGEIFKVVDIFDEFNPITDEYERKRDETRIDVPSGVGADFARVCTEVRQELDRFGLKMYFDISGRNGAMRPKWRYRLGGHLRTDFAQVTDDSHPDPYEGDPDTVPVDIVEMVRADREYYRRKGWKDWFGRKLQRKREDVVRREALVLVRSESRSSSSL